MNGARARSAARLCAVLGALAALAFAGAGAATSRAAGGAHAVTWDKYSMLVDGKRVFLWSGELHPYRLPSPDLWRDVLQKMKSNGFNAVSIYVDWGFHSPKPGVYDFTGVRDLDRFLDIATEVGIYVIARPGPYINAEVDGGGLPAWLATTPGRARTNNATYMSYTDEWQHAVDPIIARHQLTNGGGTVILYQIENEYANNVSSPTGREYMAHLYQQARANGITVPIFHNDKGRNGFWVPGDPGAPDMYAFDGYPGGTCSTGGNPGTPGAPPDWGYYGVGGRTGGASASPTTPGFTAEFGGGWFDGWGGYGYGCINTRQGPRYERRAYLTNVANGLKIQNIYMTFGGTNWGWLPAPVVYTSYDYGAAWNEARQATAKVPSMKWMGTFLQTVEPIDKVDRSTDVVASDPGVRVYHLANPDDGTQFFLVRNDSSTTNRSFTLPLASPDGSYTIPQSGSIQLNGQDMKAFVADYDLGGQHLVYSTSEIFTHAELGGRDVAILHGRSNEPGETVLRYASAPAVTVLDGDVTSTWDAARGDLRLDYVHTGVARVLVTPASGRPLLLLLADEPSVETLWRQETGAGAVFVRGPALVRTASVTGEVVALTGDTKASSPLEVWAPAGVTRVTWNGAPVDTAVTSSGSLLGQLPGPPAISLPALTGWKYAYESPESQVDFDDSGWAEATKTTSNSITAIPAGQKVLFADDYGFHHGDVWYRGRYSGATTATAVGVSYAAGGVGMVETWLDGTYLGSHQLATPAPYSTAPAEAATTSFAIPPELQTAGEHVLAVLVHTMAHNEDGGVNDAQKAARGLVGVTLTGAPESQIAWRLQGDQGGEDIVDTVRGPLNNGGLYGERAGWYLPGYPDGGWATVSLPAADPRAGVAWYRTTFDLDLPQGVDASLGLTIDDSASKAYRVLIFVNGWNMGQYVNNVGPQHTFVLPNGILRHHGRNTLALAVITNNAGGGGLGTVTLTNLATVASGLSVSNVESPAYEPPVVSVASRTVVAAKPFTADVATVSIPADAQATALAATIDWGDGTTSAGAVAGTGATRTVSGGHTYAVTGSYTVKVSLADRYAAGTIASGTGTLIAYAYPEGGGSFVVGDRSASGHVTFWGSEWAFVNELSGGPAPPSFKGFADSPETPTCGTGWSARPGGSSALPASLPDYMAVAVTDSISQKGSKLGGGTVHVVVVKVSPGYRPDPAYAGTGEVVAVVC